MHIRFTKRGVTTLLLLALLIVTVAIVLPIVTSADAEIQNFSYQTLTALNIKEDDDTDIRIVFTIGNLDYEEVGVIVSKSVANPTYEAAGCYTYKTTSVYSTINIEGTPTPAPDGRWYVAVKLTGIPHSYFDSPLYIRAFVKNADKAPTYSDASLLTICSAVGHTTHTMAWDADGSATLQTVGNLVCDCPVCGLPYEVTDVKRDALVYDSKNPSGAFVNGNQYAMYKTVREIRGDKHFYPTSKSVGADDGNDLWFEYSLLWNDSFEYRDTPANLAEIRLFGFHDVAKSKLRGFYYLYLLNDDGQGGAFNTSNDCPFKGHIDYSTYLEGCSPDENCADDLSGLGNYLNGDLIGRYAAGWVGHRDSSPYLWDSVSQTTGGWHRLGFRYHQEVASVSGTTVTYAGYTELYIDGILCWRVHTNMSASDGDGLAKNGLLLWTATAKDSKITGYTDNDNMRVAMTVDNVVASSQSVYIVVGDAYWTCGDGFVLPVERDDTPGSEKITLGGNQYDAGYYYVESPVGKTTVYSSDKTSATHRGDYKTLTNIRGDDHFYPDASNGGEGRNLYFEYDFLYNDSLQNWDRADSRSEFKVITVQTSTSNHREFYYLYFLNDDNKGPANGTFNTSNDCPYRGHFDYSTYKSDDLGVNNAVDLTSENLYLFGDLVGKYAAGWSVSRSGSPYIYDESWTTKGGNGWHRIGVMVHQEASISGNDVVYSGWTELYINGVKVWKVLTNMDTLKNMGLTLFTGAKEDANIVYSDAADDVRIGYQFDGFQSSANYAYAVFANVNWRIVDVDFDPATEIEPVNNPTAATFTLPGGQTTSGKIFYRVK
ncbi:MAG: hypothetical protein J6Z13_03155 [Clostridia bacterium]|nr:hypothetical protein [Clostridia bacterium]